MSTQEEIARPAAKSLLQRLVSGSAWALGGKIMTALAGLVANALIARLLPPQAVGAYFLLVSFVTVAVLFGQFGLQRAVVRLVAEALAAGNCGLARGTVSSVMRLGAMFSIVVAAVAHASSRIIGQGLFHTPLIENAMWMGAVWIVLLTLLGLLAESFRGFHDIRLATAFSGFVTNIVLVSALAVCFWLKLSVGFNGVVSLALSATFISLATATFLMRRHLKTIATITSVGVRRLLTLGGPLLITSLTIFVFGQADLWIVGSFRPGPDVAIYGAATRLVQLVIIPLLIINAVLPPIISDMYSRGQSEHLEKIIRGMAAAAGLPAILSLLVLMVAAPDILQLVYGQYYRAAALPLVLISMGQLVNVWGGSGMLVLMMTENQTALMKLTLTSTAILIAGDLAVVGKFGIEGVAAVTGTVIGLQTLAILFMVKRKTGMWTHFGPGHLIFAIKRLTLARNRD